MKKAKIRARARTKLVAVMLVFAVAGFSLLRFSYADSDSFSLSPSSGSYTVGNNFNVTLQESGSAATTVQAVIQFPSSLQFIGDTTNSSAPFNTNLNGTDTASGNSVTVNRTTLGGSGTGTVTVLTFKVLSAGSANVSFAAPPNSYILPSGCTSASCNALTGTPSSATYTLSNPSSGGGGGGGTTTPPSSNPTPAPTPVTSNPKNSSINVAPKSSSTSGSTTGSGTNPVTVPNNGTVSTTTPVTVEPATVQTSGVTKVEYFLNGKLVDTETKPPYKYNINTSNLKGGTYKLVSKTYYTNGSTKQSTQNLVVKNTAAQSAGLTWLYLLIVGIILLLGLGVNFLGPTAGAGPFNRLFRGRGGRPSIGGPAPAGWPGSSGGVTSPTVTPAPPSPPTAAAPVAPPALPEPASPDTASRLNHLHPPHGPAPGTVFRPPSSSS